MSRINTFLGIIFCFFFGFVLTGCGTTHLNQGKSLKEVEPKVIPKSTGKKIITEIPTLPTYEYGRFTVVVYPDKHKIVGGEFTPEATPPLESKYVHTIYVNYATKELQLYSYGKPVIGYAVVTPDPNFLPIEVVRGVVTKIDRSPSWGPTANIRLKYPDLPPGIIPYGHPRNAMGEVKFEIAWNVPGWQYMRIHGTEGYVDGGRFWEMETFGCIRVQNKAIKNLANLLGLKDTKEKIEVVVFRGDRVL